MSPLVEQIVQKLELLPDQALRQVLAVVNSLEPSAMNLTQTTEAQDQNESETTSSLKKVGNVWVVKASGQTSIDWHDYVNREREERIEKLMGW